jgi:hypothetical protein
MKKSNYILILVILLILLICYGYYIQYYGNIFEGLDNSSGVSQTTTNNSPTSDLPDFRTPLLLFLNNIDTITFINDPSTFTNTKPRITIANLNIKLDGQPVDLGTKLNNYLMNTNAIDIKLLDETSTDKTLYDILPGKILTKTSDNTKYTGIDFNYLINNYYMYLKDNINNIKIVRKPFTDRVSTTAPIGNYFTINNLAITVDGVKVSMDMVNILANAVAAQVDSIDITTSNTDDKNRYIDIKTKAPLTSTIDLKNKY